jgi:hypothetical protein
MRVDLANEVIALEDHAHLAGGLNDAHRKGEEHNARHTGRKAVQDWVLRIRGCTWSVSGFGSFEFRPSVLGFMGGSLEANVTVSSRSAQTPDWSGVHHKVEFPYGFRLIVIKT